MTGRKKKTKEEVIQDFIKVHGDKYDYSKFEYTGALNKVKIICKKHGLFEQTSANHKYGNGCRKCQYDNKTLSTEKCIKQFKKVHGDIYDYSQVEYTGNINKVKIICPEHGIFNQRPNIHKSGQACPSCADNKTLNTEETIQAFIKVHGSEKYDYSKVEYINARTKVKIICPEHGIFNQRPNDHKSGYGCSSCAKYGYDNSKEGSFYIQKLFKDDVFIGVKIGITNKDPIKRMKQQSRCSIYRHELFTTIQYKDGKVAQELELRLKQQFGKFRSTIDKESMNDGYTETYSKESLMYIIPFIESQYKLILEEKPQ